MLLQTEKQPLLVAAERQKPVSQSEMEINCYVGKMCVKIKNTFDIISEPWARWCLSVFLPTSDTATVSF